MARGVFVISGPRTGSSCIAGCLHNLGCNMGQGHLQAADGLNPKGYYEDLRWQQVNKEAVGHGYSVGEVSVSGLHMQKYRRLAQGISARNQLWGVKGPRMAFVFPYIQDVLAEVCNLRMVVVERDKDASVDSLVQHSARAYGGRRKLTRENAGKLMARWLGAVEMAAAYFHGPLLRVAYEDYVSSGESAVAALTTLNDWVWEDLDDPNKVISHALGWIDEELDHHADTDAHARQGESGIAGHPGFIDGWMSKRPCKGCGGQQKGGMD